MALLQRFFNLQPSKPFLPISTLTPHQRAVFQECIFHLRAEITTLQDRINTSFSNISTIIRCINSNITHLQCLIYIHRYGIMRQEIQNVILVLEEKYARKPFASSAPQHFANSGLDTRGEAALVCLATAPAKRQKQKQKQEVERNSVNSFSLSRAPLDFMPMVSEEGKLKAEFHVLVLKRAEGTVEADRLEGTLVFWASVWEDIECAVRVSRVKEADMEPEMRMRGEAEEMRRCEEGDFEEGGAD